MFLGGIETLKFNNFGFVGKGEGMEYILFQSWASGVSRHCTYFCTKQKCTVITKTNVEVIIWFQNLMTKSINRKELYKLQQIVLLYLLSSKNTHLFLLKKLKDKALRLEHLTIPVNTTFTHP